MKILIAIHGNEPAGWARDPPRILALPSDAVVRLLPVVGVAPRSLPGSETRQPSSIRPRLGMRTS